MTHCIYKMILYHFAGLSWQVVNIPGQEIWRGDKKHSPAGGGQTRQQDLHACVWAFEEEQIFTEVEIFNNWYNFITSPSVSKLLDYWLHSWTESWRPTGCTLLLILFLDKKKYQRESLLGLKTHWLKRYYEKKFYMPTVSPNHYSVFVLLYLYQITEIFGIRSNCWSVCQSVCASVCKLQLCLSKP